MRGCLQNENYAGPVAGAILTPVEPSNENREGTRVREMQISSLIGRRSRLRRIIKLRARVHYNVVNPQTHFCVSGRLFLARKRRRPAVLNRARRGPKYTSARRRAPRSIASLFWPCRLSFENQSGRGPPGNRFTSSPVRKSTNTVWRKFARQAPPISRRL